MKLCYFVVFLFLFLWGCGSADKPRVFEKTYDVLDAQLDVIPSWLEDPYGWAEEFDAKEAAQSRYFVYLTELKNSRSLACKIARANATAFVAGEISQSIKESFGHGLSEEGGQLEEYVENTLVHEIEGSVIGARVHRTYWEQRFYRDEKNVGAERVGFVCAVLVKIGKGQLKLAMKRANEKLDQQVAPKARPMLKKALEEASNKLIQIDGPST